MQLDIPFYEGPEDALKAAVQAMGGAKKIGPLLWPDKSIDTAARLLLDCLNAGRSEKLDLSQTMMIFRMARDAGCYSPFVWFANEVGFDAKAATKAEEIDRVTTVIEQATTTLAGALKTLERLKSGAPVRSAA
ncbi:hypothetical protein NCI_04906 [Burkholderia pseudomallei]|uniref:hypothetical protein n=1 Tax=Burkholderia pseudomallei TaxID=28450 RepID=UPI0005388BE4|nr:hypothetical protein [Burkholderia pseudomallei]KGW27068.1 hypothetical protein Y602_1968 [Burkholderia pseudomallei MSHR733]ONC38500.1 hypothetical protein AQ916_07035 [Burkholderia pseudomallei]CRY35321.1 Uncharacterised protein [Burkholderia pseudomallei]